MKIPGNYNVLKNRVSSHPERSGRADQIAGLALVAIAGRRSRQIKRPIVVVAPSANRGETETLSVKNLPV